MCSTTNVYSTKLNTRHQRRDVDTTTKLSLHTVGHHSRQLTRADTAVIAYSGSPLKTANKSRHSWRSPNQHVTRPVSTSRLTYVTMSKRTLTILPDTALFAGSLLSAAENHDHIYRSRLHHSDCQITAAAQKSIDESWPSVLFYIIFIDSGKDRTSPFSHLSHPMKG